MASCAIVESVSSLKRLLHASLADAALLLTAPAITGCGQLTEGLEAAKEVNAEIEEELGIKVHTNFEITDGDQSVTVTIPADANKSPDTQKKVLEIVRKHFPEAKEIKIAMSN